MHLNYKDQKDRLRYILHEDHFVLTGKQPFHFVHRFCNKQQLVFSFPLIHLIFEAVHSKEYLLLPGNGLLRIRLEF